MAKKMKGLLKLQLQTAAGISRRRLHDELDAVRISVNRAKNSIMLDWFMWRKQNPDWQPEQRRDREGNLKAFTDGLPVMEDPAISQAMERDLYTHARRVTPELFSKIVARCCTAAVQTLKFNVPYNHQGKAKKIWQALLLHETQLNDYNKPRSGRSIPISNQETYIYYAGACNRHGVGIEQRIREFAGNSVAIRFALWSRASGRSQIDVIARVAVGKMRQGHRRILRQIAAGEIKACDSLVVEDNGKWYVHLVYELTPAQSTADPNRKAVLTMGTENALTLSFPDNADGKPSRPWRIGNDEYLRVQLTRLISRRKAIEFGTRFGQNRGHGRRPIVAIQTRNTRQQRHQMKAYRGNVVADIIKACQRNNCGTLVYREPTLPLRKRSWFATEGIDFNWRDLDSDLAYKSERNGLQYKTERMRTAEWLENQSTS
jgi:hypothetical protein